jgi:hypothetical protein
MSCPDPAPRLFHVRALNSDRGLRWSGQRNANPEFGLPQIHRERSSQARVGGLLQQASGRSEACRQRHLHAPKHQPLGGWRSGSRLLLVRLPEAAKQQSFADASIGERLLDKDGRLYEFHNRCFRRPRESRTDSKGGIAATEMIWPRTAPLSTLHKFSRLRFFARQPRD